MTLGNKLQRLRHEWKLTQETVAIRLGIDRTTVSDYERDKRKPSFDILISLARIYHVSIDYLFGLTNRRYIDTTDLPEVEYEKIIMIIEEYETNKS